MRRCVTSRLVYLVDAPAVLELQVGVSTQHSVDDELSVTLDGVPLEVNEQIGAVGTRHHLVKVQAGLVEVEYAARVDGPVPPVPVEPLDAFIHTRPSRYCRDYAHLTVAMLRACGVPARLVAVYAPGLAPMDFHAVVEAIVDEQWRVVDPTLLAPRASLVRIATGRDAADTAFLTNHGGYISLVAMEVGAVVDGLLPTDDVTELVSIT